MKELKRAIAISSVTAEKTRSSSQQRDEQPDNPELSRDATSICTVLGITISLAARGLRLPELSGSFADRLSKRLSVEVFKYEKEVIDESQFAKAAAKAIGSLSPALSSMLSQDLSTGDVSLEEDIICALQSFARNEIKATSIEELRENSLLSSSLLPGWIYQLSRAKESAHVAKQAGFIEQYAISTQWFTPLWISEFLCQECLTDSTATFIDPACGAGHILVPALERLLKSESHPSRTVKSRLGEILKDKLFGIDTDPTMTALSTIAIYLCARDHCRTDQTEPLPELPPPHIYTIDHVAGCDNNEFDHNALIGSLWLGASQTPYHLVLRRAGEMSAQSIAALLPERFDAIAANPPYLSHRNMPDFMRRFLIREYPHSRYDLYAAFLELCVRLLSDGGRLAMICQQSFLSIQRYHQLRKELDSKTDIRSIVQLGPGAFAAKQGEKVNNALVVMERRNGKVTNTVVRCARILGRKEKEKAEREGLGRLLESKPKPIIGRSVERAPYSLWCPREIGALFDRHPPLSREETGIILTNGLFTCNNKLFVKHYSEVSDEERHEYVPYDKGGGHKWFRTTPLVLRWTDNGENIRAYRKERGQSRSLPGEQFYFHQGITYSYIGTKRFKARLLSPSCIFDIASSALFSRSVSLQYLLGFLNSALSRFFLAMLNPTINFQIGDLRRIPFLHPDRETENEVASLAQRCVELARKHESFDLASPSYKPCPSECFDSLSGYRAYLEELKDMNHEERSCQGTIDALIFDLYGLSSEARRLVREDPFVQAADVDAFCAPAYQSCVKRAEQMTINSRR